MTARKFYLAGPLFNSAEREYSERLRSILSAHFEVYVPYIDGELLPNLLSSGAPFHEATRRIFETDVAAIRGCDFLLIILNGRTVDEGAAFELGVAWTLGKTCFGIKDDFRQLVSSGDNPMIEGSLEQIFHDESELKQWIERNSV